MAAQDSLKVASIFGRTASGSATGVADVDQEELRFAATALLGPGYLRSMIDQTANTSSFNVRQDTGTNLQLKIGSGTTKKDGYVLLGTVAGQGAYIVRLDAATKTITVPAADATNPARYGVYLYIDDTAYSGTASRAYAQVACIRGTPAGSPTTPGPLATYSAYALLWEFQLAANATAVTNTILDNTGISTDRRTPSELAITRPGEVTRAVQGSVQSGITTIADVTTLTVTWVANASRKYRVVAEGPVVSGGGGTLFMYVTDGSNVIKNLSTMNLGASESMPMRVTERITGASGTTTRKIRASASGGTMQVGTTISAVPYFAEVWVEDMGPV